MLPSYHIQHYGFWEVAAFSHNETFCTSQYYEPGSEAGGEWLDFEKVLRKCLAASYDNLRGVGVMCDRILSAPSTCTKQSKCLMEDQHLQHARNNRNV